MEPITTWGALQFLFWPLIFLFVAAALAMIGVGKVKKNPDGLGDIIVAIAFVCLLVSGCWLGIKKVHRDIYNIAANSGGEQVCMTVTQITDD